MAYFTLLIALSASTLFLLSISAAPMNEGHSNYIHWPNELGSIFDPGQNSQNHASEPWNTFAEMSLNQPHQGYDYSQHQHQTSPNSPSYYYSNHEQSPMHLSPYREPLEGTYWPSHATTHKEDNLPPISSDFDYDVVQQFSPPEEQVHGSPSPPSSPSDIQHERSSRVLEFLGKGKKKKIRHIRARKADGSWKDQFPLHMGEINTILMDATGKHESTIIKVLSKEGNKEIGNEILSKDLARIKTAMEKMGLKQKRPPQRRSLFLGNKTSKITDAYAEFRKIGKQTARKHLNERIDEEIAGLLMNKDTFKLGAKMIETKRGSKDGSNDINTDFQNTYYNEYRPEGQYGGYDSSNGNYHGGSSGYRK